MWNLYVWEDVLYDWSGGMVVIIATTFEDAIEVARGQLPECHINELRQEKPKITELRKNQGSLTRKMWYVYGGS